MQGCLSAALVDIGRARHISLLIKLNSRWSRIVLSLHKQVSLQADPAVYKNRRIPVLQEFRYSASSRVRVLVTANAQMCKKSNTLGFNAFSFQRSGYGEFACSLHYYIFFLLKSATLRLLLFRLINCAEAKFSRSIDRSIAIAPRESRFPIT